MAATETIPLAALPGWGKKLVGEVLGASWAKTLRACGARVAASAKENFAAGKGPDDSSWPRLAHRRPSNRGTDQPLRDKGLLAASMSARGKGFFQQVEDFRLEQGTNLEYAALHQYGGVVSAKRAKYLTIPLTKEAARSGGARQFPRKLFFLRSKKGSLFLAETKTKGRKKAKSLTLHYILKKSVTVPTRPFLGFGEWLLRQLDVILADELRRRARG